MFYFFSKYKSNTHQDRDSRYKVTADPPRVQSPGEKRKEMLKGDSRKQSSASQKSHMQGSRQVSQLPFHENNKNNWIPNPQ